MQLETEKAALRLVINPRRQIEKQGFHRLGGEVCDTPDASGLLGNKQLAAVGLAGANANWFFEGDPGQNIARVIVEQLRIIRVTESGVGFANQFSLPRRLAKEGDHGEPADASQRRKPNVLLSREKHETKRLTKLLRAVGVGELFSRRFLLGEAVERAEASDQVARVEPGDRPAGEAVAQDAQRSLVVGVAVRRHYVVTTRETDAVRPWPSEPRGGVWLPLGRHASAGTVRGGEGWVGIRKAQVRARVPRRRPSIDTIPRAATAGRVPPWHHECARGWCCQ